MKYLHTFVYSVMAGVSIGIGAVVFLMIENKIIASLFFTIGLFTIVMFGFHLFTGRVSLLPDKNKWYIIDLIIIWLGIFVGTWGTAMLLGMTRISDTFHQSAVDVCAAKSSDGYLSLFILAVFCNIMIFIAVDGYNNIPYQLGKYIALFLGVAVFILSGYEHCVANMFFFSAAKAWNAQTLLRLIVVTLGNTLGGVIIPLVKKFKVKA